ncbi:DUF4123 domain-containing protein [Aestuariibius sp. 2305UL40-4]|uniref:DUF4123 domain-containing protein n=1 Tax=Aestuariibius violaceus TaxID=3234132 RepID=UPI00345E33A1
MTDAEPVLSVEALEIPPLPPQADLPFWAKDWIVPELHDLLFGDPAPRTYLVVDATLRSNVTGLFDLDTVDVPIRCLFQGAAEVQFAESAPYLIDLTRPDDAVPDFHRDFFPNHWDKGTGILLTTDATMDELWRHLRKFTKSHSEEGPHRFFRFWEPNVTRDYFEAVARMPSRAKDLFQLKTGKWIGRIVSYARAVDQACQVVPDRNLIGQAVYSGGPFRLTAEEEAALLKGVLRGHAKALELKITDDAAQVPPMERERVVLDTVLDHHRAGIRDLGRIRAEALARLQAG